MELKVRQINSFLTLSRERAMTQAAKIDGMAARGEALPVLAGVPIGIKDVLTMTGSPATAGSLILKGYRPPYDATAVAKLEAAGAVLLGKINCDEFAMGSSNENSAYGAVKNPKALDRVPGGSSGGSAAAVAADFAVATLGTDTGGSIRQPAAFCGVVGVLPTYGRVSRYGLIAFASSLDRVGPFARTVKDAATMLQVLAGKDVMDATSSDRPVDDYVGALGQPVAGLRVGVPEEYFGEGLDPEIRAAIERVLDGLKAAGCVVKPVSLPHTKYAIPTYYVIATAEASSNLSRFDGVRFGLRAEEAKTLSAMYRKTRDEGFGAEVKRRILLGTYALSCGVLRCVLPQGSAGEDAADAGLSGGVCGGGCAGDAGDADSGVQAGGEDGGSGEDVPGGYLLGGGEPGGDLRDECSLRGDEGRVADWSAGDGQALR